MRWFMVLCVILGSLAIVHAQEETYQANTNSCESAGWICKPNCTADESIVTELTTPCLSGSVCCKPLTQATVNPDASSNTCTDGTPHNTCSSTIKPNYCSSQGTLTQNCQICGCPNLQDTCNADGTCTIATSQGQQSTDLSLINKPPLTVEVPFIYAPLQLDLNLYAIDPESQPLKFSFQDGTAFFNSPTTQCTLTGSILNCNSGAISGDQDLTILISDGSKIGQLTTKIINRQGQQPTTQGIINTPPEAIAGENRLAFPNQKITLDGSESFDVDGNLIFQDNSFLWKQDTRILGRGVTIDARFNQPGSYKVELEVTDQDGATGIDTMIITIQEKTHCKSTTTAYFPEDTICENKWPSNEGELIVINSRGYSCDLVEVCDPGLDPIIEDAINCCDGTPLTDPKKANACTFANKYSMGNTLRCEGIYLTKGVGDNAIYMQDYLEAEMCCYGVDAICTNPGNLYTANPIPKTKTSPVNIQCKTTPDKRVLGNWVSDTRLDLNNIALNDVHAGASLNVLSTGTCVDYGFSLLTLLRKAGYGKEDVLLAEAPNHAYNLVRLPLDRKYHIIDTTGNNAPSFVLGGTPYGYDYCRNIVNCYNDYGKQLCPELKSIVGCEGISEGFVKQSSRIGFKTKEFVKGAISLVTEEAKR